MRSVEKEQEYGMHQEELSSQAHIHQQEMEAQRYEQELFAKQVAFKEEQRRQLVIKLQELKAQAASCALSQPIIQERSKLKIPSYKPTKEVRQPLQEPLIEHGQPAHFIDSQSEMCNVAEPDEQDTKLSWQPSWTKHPGFQMPNLIKVVTCESSPDQGPEKEVISSNLIEQEVLDSVADLHVYSEMDSQQVASLATGDSFDQREVVVLLFEELPSFVNQEKEEEIPVTSVQQGVHDQDADQSLESCFGNIIADFCEKLEMSEFVPIQRCSVMEDILSNDYVQEGKLEPSALDSKEISSFDKLLADLTEDDDVLTMEEELTWQLLMQDSHEEPERSKESSSIKPEFIISRGCPIRHLSRKGPVPKIPIIEQQIQHVYSPQICIDIDQIQEVCDLVFHFQDMLQEFQVLQVVWHIFSIAYMHASHPLLVRKGKYFNEPVNGFV